MVTPTSQDDFSEEIADLQQKVNELREAAESLCDELSPELDLIPKAVRGSAVNLVHYMALRRKDLRVLQLQLAQWGLSSLGRLEGHVMPGLRSVANALAGLSRQTPQSEKLNDRQNFKQGDLQLEEHSLALFGARQRGHATRIMVTLPTEAATDLELVESLIKEGMDVARINTAHDGAQVWNAMVRNVRSSSEKLGLSCKILMDLEGPKLRTGAMVAGPRVLHVNVKRDDRGVVRAPTEVHLIPTTQRTQDHRGACVPIPMLLWEQSTEGDTLEFTDIPGRQRSVVVVRRDGASVVAQTRQGFYIEPGVEITLKRQGRILAMGVIGELPATPTQVFLVPGELLTVSGESNPGHSAQVGADGHVVSCANVSCTLPEVFGEIAPNDRIFFDDGKIAGVVRQADRNSLQVEILRTPPGGTRLGADKGINLPDTVTSLPALSTEDLEHLDFAAVHADIIGLSFVRTPQDITHLHEEMDKRGAGHLAVILKIETKVGFENLPDLLLTGLRRPPVGVMVARGDLGVELGFERMAEVQEQILWLCEAAHVPVIWATQVLDTLNKKGVPTRGEVTDAAMSSRAECVMLNKGPHVVETVRFLSDILTRMQDHHQKKTPMLRMLKVSQGLHTP